MSLTVTLIILALATAIFAWSVWRVRREVPGEPSLIPHGAIQFLCAIALILMAAHLVSLLTGQPLTGRMLGGR
jgi:hypothetical protein